MATQIRRTTPPSPTSRFATVKASMVTAWCGLVLWGAVVAQAGGDGTGIPLNGTPLPGVPITGLAPNGALLYGLPINGLAPNAVPITGLAPNGAPLYGLPINGLAPNAVPITGLAPNGAPLYGLPIPGLLPQGVTSDGTAVHPPLRPAVPPERVPFTGRRPRALGKPSASWQPSARGFQEPTADWLR